MTCGSRWSSGVRAPTGAPAPGATGNGQEVAPDLDTRYRNTTGMSCPEFATSWIETSKQYAPNVPAQTRELEKGAEKVAEKVWRNAMRKLATTAANADCRTACNGVKTGW